MSVLEKIYAQGGDVILHVLEIFSDAWHERIVLIRDFVDHIIITEDGRELTARASGMAVALPKRDATGAQTLKFAIDGVRPEATRLLRAAQDTGAQINMTYRVYLASDLAEPAEPPLFFIVREFLAAADRVEITAGLFDLINMRWPRTVYDSSTAPGLKYLR